VVDGPFLDVPGVPPVDKPKAWGWLGLAVGGFLAGQILATIFLAIGAAVAHRKLTVVASLAEPPTWAILLQLLGIWCGFAVAPWAASALAGTKRFFLDLGVRFRLVDVAGILVGLGGQLVVIALYAPFLTKSSHFDAPTKKLTGASHGVGFFFVALGTIFVAPVLEELFFRGLLFKSLARLFTPSGGGRGAARAAGITGAVILDGVLFGLAHGEWLQLPGLALFGMALAFISYRTGRLGMNMVAHASFNATAIVGLLLAGGGVVH
jgi:membrane protease YdiL (CAAX protease family)